MCGGRGARWKEGIQEMTEDGKSHLYTDLWQPGIGFCGSPENKRMCQAERAKICRKWARSTWRLSKGLRWGL